MAPVADGLTSSERRLFGRARCKHRAHTTGTGRARSASISRTLNSRPFCRSSKFEKFGMSELGKSTRRMVLLSNFYSSAAPTVLIVGAAEDDRPKIKGLFWVVWVFGRA